MEKKKEIKIDLGGQKFANHMLDSDHFRGEACAHVVCVCEARQGAGHITT